MKSIAVVLGLISSWVAALALPFLQQASQGNLVAVLAPRADRERVIEEATTQGLYLNGQRGRHVLMLYGPAGVPSRERLRHAGVILLLTDSGLPICRS